MSNKRLSDDLSNQEKIKILPQILRLPATGVIDLTSSEYDKNDPTYMELKKAEKANKFSGKINLSQMQGVLPLVACLRMKLMACDG